MLGFETLGMRWDRPHAAHASRPSSHACTGTFHTTAQHTHMHTPSRRPQRLCHAARPPHVRRYHPRLNVLYVLSECIDTLGYLTAFAVDPTSGALCQLGKRISMTGRSTCYISFDKDAHHAVVTNYWDAKINVVKLDPSTGEPLAVVQEHQQTRRATWRQVEDRPVSWRALRLRVDELACVAGIVAFGVGGLSGLCGAAQGWRSRHQEGCGRCS